MVPPALPLSTALSLQHQMSAKDLLLFSQFQKRRGQAVSSFFELQKQQKALADIWCFVFSFYSLADATKKHSLFCSFCSYFVILYHFLIYTIRNFTFDFPRLYLEP